MGKEVKIETKPCFGLPKVMLQQLSVIYRLFYNLHKDSIEFTCLVLNES